jgi:hypothetical protein
MNKEQYKITDYTKQRAKQIGVYVRQSNNLKYKLDVFDLNGNYILSCGANGYFDYPTYINERGIEYANKRRKLYKQRHNKDRNIQGSRGWFSDNLLW